MEMNTVLSIIIVVFGILQIILFFKIWGMTNDVRAIRNKYLQAIIRKHRAAKVIRRLIIRESTTRPILWL